MKNFWQKLKKPFFVLAPMDDVTDTVFRQIVASCGKPDVLFTEFVSSDGLCSRGQEKLLNKFQFEKSERPIVAQIWGAKPENILESAKLVEEIGFDGVDINMGCPDRQVVKNGGGAALIKNHDLAKEIILAAKKGAKGLPISIKTRIGFDEVQTEEWIGFLLGLGLDALIIHGRTKKEMSNVSANWEEIGKAVRLRDKLGLKTLIIGNGDVKSYGEGLEKSKKFGVDGIMIGRGVFENLWIFNPDIDIQKISPEDRIKVLMKHVELFNVTWGKGKNFNILKKFFKAYIRDFDGASDLRVKLMETKSAGEVKRCLLSYNI